MQHRAVLLRVDAQNVALFLRFLGSSNFRGEPLAKVRGVAFEIFVSSLQAPNLAHDVRVLASQRRQLRLELHAHLFQALFQTFVVHVERPSFLHDFPARLLRALDANLRRDRPGFELVHALDELVAHLLRLERGFVAFELHLHERARDLEPVFLRAYQRRLKLFFLRQKLLVHPVQPLKTLQEGFLLR